MSSDKSKLKGEVLRLPIFDEARLVVDATTLLVTPYEPFLPPNHPHFGDVRVILEDASVRMVGGMRNLIKKNMDATGVPPQGAVAISLFLRPIEQAWAATPHLHTYVLSFDKKAFVPDAKAATQKKRVTAVLAGMKRQREEQEVDEDGEALEWDGTSPIIAFNAPLPSSWSKVKLNRAAFTRAHQDLITALCARVTPPPGCRLIIDAQFDEEHAKASLVLETTLDGHVLEAYEAPLLHNEVGEADMVVQYYTQLALRGPKGIYTGPPRECSRRQHQQDASLASVYSAEERANITKGNSGVLQSTPPEHYAKRGHVLVRTTDTDLAVLGLAMYASLCNNDDTSISSLPALQHTVYVSLGNAWFNRDTLQFGTPRDRVSTRHYELYDMQALHRIVATQLCPIVDDGTTSNATTVYRRVLSFVAFALSCGNDYVRKCVESSSRLKMFEAFCAKVYNLVSYSSTTAMLDYSAFESFIGECYKRRVLGVSNGFRYFRANPRPQHNHTYQEICDATYVARSDPKSHAPPVDILRQVHARVNWCLQYALTGPLGLRHIPQCTGIMSGAAVLEQRAQEKKARAQEREKYLEDITL